MWSRKWLKLFLWTALPLLRMMFLYVLCKLIISGSEVIANLARIRLKSCVNSNEVVLNVPLLLKLFWTKRALKLRSHSLLIYLSIIFEPSSPSCTSVQIHLLMLCLLMSYKASSILVGLLAARKHAMVLL